MNHLSLETVSDKHRLAARRWNREVQDRGIRDSRYDFAKSSMRQGSFDYKTWPLVLPNKYSLA